MSLKRAIIRVCGVLFALALSGCMGLLDVARYEASIERLDYPRNENLNWPQASRPIAMPEFENLGFNSLLVWNHGEIVFEWYRRGQTAQTPQNIKSVSKLVLSALVGISEIDIDAPIYSIAGCPVPEALQPLTPRHLLNMSAGFSFHENATNHIFAAPRWACAALALPIEAQSGARFNYGTIQSYLLGAYLSEQLGEDLKTYADRVLFSPLGIGLDGWVRSPEGYYFAGSEMRMTPRDMLALSLLFLKRNQNIIPNDWVTQSRQTVWPNASAALGYGGHWWHGPNLLMAHGYGGQAVLIDHQRQLVLVATAPSGGLVSGKVHDARIRRLMEIFTELQTLHVAAHGRISNKTHSGASRERQ